MVNKLHNLPCSRRYVIQFTEQRNYFLNSSKFETFKASPFSTLFNLNYLRPKYELPHFG
jgi:hypothetical protein